MENNKEELLYFTESELPAIAKTIIRWIQGVPLVYFCGEMGAGKTTLIKEILYQLGSTDEVSSPTYAIVNQYATNTPGFETVFHLDLYRLKNLDELISLPIDDYIYSGYPCFIEWPELLEDMDHGLKSKRLKLESQPDGSRKILFL
jgi:tRNA threonylcarbamoyladenosine biosynthesis protein TsaE